MERLARNFSIALASVVLFCFANVNNSLASEPANKASLESVAAKDGSLHAALKSYSKDEQRLRDEFGKKLTEVQEARLRAFEQAFSRAVSKRQPDSVAALAEVIKELKGTQPSELISTKDKQNFVGTTLRWGGFVMFLGPNGAAWFVNMDADRDVHRFAWKPVQANAIKLTTTHPDPTKQNSTITLNGDKFVLEENDTGRKESGAVFKP